MKEPQDHKKSSKRKNPVVITVLINNDQEAAEQFYEKQEELSLLKLRVAMSGDNDAPSPVELELELLKRIETLEPMVQALGDQLKEAALKFKFKSIGRNAYNKLVDDNPPTAEDVKVMEDAGEDPKQLRWSPRTFFPALTIASCCEAPDGIAMEEIWEDPDWNDAELAELSQAALNANTSRRLVPLGNG